MKILVFFLLFIGFTKFHDCKRKHCQYKNQKKFKGGSVRDSMHFIYPKATNVQLDSILNLKK